MSSPIKVCTATERVLTTVELLTHILEHSYYHNYNSGQTYRNALVSKTWSNEALDILWSGIGSFLYLLKLLGPMSAVEEVEGVNFVRITINLTFDLPPLRATHRNMTGTFALRIGMFSNGTHRVSAKSVT